MLAEVIMSAAQNKNSVDVQDFINSQPIGRLHLLVIGLCFLVTAVDGLDTAAVGFIAPALRAEWALPPEQLNPLLSAALVGLMLGAFGAGPLADRLGRKRLLVGCVLLFGGCSLVSAFAHNVEITLTSEYCPSRRRSLMVTGMFCGFTLGSALGGVAASHLVPLYGWRSVLLLGGTLPILLVPLLMWLMPESVRYLVLRDASDARVARLLGRLGQQPEQTRTQFFLNEEEQGGSVAPSAVIFGPKLRLGTCLLWVNFFTSLCIIYVITNWLPTLLTDNGRTISQAASISSWFQVGGTMGALCLGAAMDKLDRWRGLTFAYLVGAAGLVGIARFADHYLILILCVITLGFCISGSQVGGNALAAAFYPTSGRATDVAWAQGLGRIGAITGTILGGSLIASGFGFTTIFTLLALPAALGALAIFAMGQHYRVPRSTESTRASKILQR
nr:MFS transporter [Pseudomonas synxantha]